jgi:DNA-binding transcriptional regulator/RsmH inhibitor MraZ
VYLFTGHRDHRVDGKDRIVVPVAYAQAIQTQGEGTLYLVPDATRRFLEAYPADVFKQMAAGLVPSRFDGDQEQKRRFFQHAEAAPLKGPGRIALPKRFLALFPKRLVRVCGMNTYLELWDPDLWDRTDAEAAGGSSRGSGAARR